MPYGNPMLIAHSIDRGALHGLRGLASADDRLTRPGLGPALRRRDAAEPLANAVRGKAIRKAPWGATGDQRTWLGYRSIVGAGCPGVVADGPSRRGASDESEILPVSGIDVESVTPSALLSYEGCAKKIPL